MIKLILTICRKEIRDNFRDRRTMLSALVFGPLFGPVIFGLAMTTTLNRATSTADEALALAVLGADNAPNLIAYLEQQNTDLSFPEISFEQAKEDVRTGEREIVVIIPDGFGDAWSKGKPARVEIISDSSDSTVSRKTRRTGNMLNNYGGQVSAMRLVARGVNPQVMRAINVDHIDISTPSTKAAMLLGMVSYFVLISMLMGGMYLAIDTTAGERERGSLEPLLTLPISRGALLVGKLMATCFFMAASLAIALLSFMVVMKRIPLAELGLSVDFGPQVALTAFFLTVPFVVIGGALMTVVASFTKSFKEAQTYVNLLMLVPIVPIMIATLFELRPSLEWMFVPSMSQHFLLLDLFKGEPVNGLFAAISIGSTVIYGVILAAIAARLYRREGLLV